MKLDAFCGTTLRPYDEPVPVLEGSVHGANLRKWVTSTPVVVAKDIRFAEMGRLGGNRQVVMVAVVPVGA